MWMNTVKLFLKIHQSSDMDTTAHKNEDLSHNHGIQENSDSDQVTLLSTDKMYGSIDKDKNLHNDPPNHEPNGSSCCCFPAITTQSSTTMRYLLTALLLLVTFLTRVDKSMLAPFYPTHAYNLNITESAIGAVFGIGPFSRSRNHHFIRALPGRSRSSRRNDR